jgi:hypothetical protein
MSIYGLDPSEPLEEINFQNSNEETDPHLQRQVSQPSLPGGVLNWLRSILTSLGAWITRVFTPHKDAEDAARLLPVNHRNDGSIRRTDDRFGIGNNSDSDDD